jgi:hypothetical protein
MSAARVIGYPSTNYAADNRFWEERSYHTSRFRNVANSFRLELCRNSVIASLSLFDLASHRVKPKRIIMTSTDTIFSSAADFAAHLRALRKARPQSGPAVPRRRRTPLGRKARSELLEKTGGRCHICGGGEENGGQSTNLDRLAVLRIERNAKRPACRAEKPLIFAAGRRTAVRNVYQIKNVTD